MKLFYGINSETNICEVLVWAYSDQYKEPHQYYLEVDSTQPYESYAQNVGNRLLPNGEWEVIPKPPSEPTEPTITDTEKLDYLIADALDKDELALDQYLLSLEIKLNQELGGL